MNKLYFGYFTGTHGIKGELNCYSDFPLKERVLVVDFPIIIQDTVHHITNIRPHQNHYLVTIDHLEDINLVEAYRHQDIYLNRDDLHLSSTEYLITDLIGYTVSDGKILGKVTNIRYNKAGYLLEVSGKKKFLIPYHDTFIKKVDLDTQTIKINHIEGLIL